mmetsp:Transcript_22860/g.35182  ORF Transcript_22860/g.35182 Transcript_22860/m.35182 type:complete len:123 (+) Transcript_22860:791-1159(+)
MFQQKAAKQGQSASPDQTASFVKDGKAKVNASAKVKLKNLKLNLAKRTQNFMNEAKEEQKGEPFESALDSSYLSVQQARSSTLLEKDPKSEAMFSANQPGRRSMMGGPSDQMQTSDYLQQKI